MSIEYVRRGERVAFRSYTDGSGGVLLQLDTSLYFALNHVGALVWELIGSGNDLDGIVREVSARFEDANENLKRDVTEFISAMVDRGLVIIDDRSMAS